MFVMKRIVTLLLLAFAAFSFKTQAQGTLCNAEFAVQFLNNNTVKFNPVIPVGSPSVGHFWNFGDGSPVNNTVSPTHAYALPGTYAVIHTVVVYNPNGIPECTQSFTRSVTITTPCNLVVDFSWASTSASPLTIAFQNLSVPLSNTDSITWNFGDNTTSHDVNPVHTYANAGTYNVCLIVKKNPGPTVSPCIKYICKTVVVQTPPCNLVADFNWTVTTTNPLRFEFHNTSSPMAASDSVRWTFGDGTVLNGVQGDPAVANPVHTYAQPGTYSVCIRVKKNNNTGTAPCIRETCKTVVAVLPCNLQPDFNWTVTATNPLRIEFHNLTINLAVTDSIRWTFGDGSSSSDVNPVHTYNVAGTYTVCLRILRYNTPGTTPCIREICKTIVVTTPCNLQAYFSAQPDPNHPLRIKFTNLSNPILPSDSVRWTFGDGTSISGLQSDPNVANPTHDYANAGTYTVCIRVKKNINSTPSPCVSEYCKQVVVTAPCNVQVDFSWRLDSINPRKVYFTNLTVSPTAAAIVTWTFGDGTSASTWNAIHEYAQPGRYRVCLRIEFGPNCVREKCDSVFIPNPPPPCNNQSNFNFVRASTNSQTYTFIPQYQSSAAQYTWTFGDGTGSHDMIATHHYAQPGTYTACLTVWRSSTCASTTCKTIQVAPQINCDSAHVTYTYQADPQVPNKIHFYATGSLPILDQTWTITRVPVSAGGSTITLHQNNPTYLFPDTGYYRVCLRAITLGGCIKEYCSIIHIAQVANVCELQAFPNPASTIVNVNVTLTQPVMIHAYVYNSQNVLVREKHQQGNTGLNVVSFNINDLPAGLYTIKLIYGDRTCYARFQKL